MRNQGRIVLGVLVLAAGLLALLGSLLDVDTGALCLPVALVALGVWVLVRPRILDRDTALRMSVFGPVRREGEWTVSDQEIWLFIGDLRLDFGQAVIPAGETRISLYCFVGDVRVHVPQGVGVSIGSVAFVTSTRLFGRKRDGFVSTHVATEGYEAAERKIRLDLVAFVSDVKVDLA